MKHTENKKGLALSIEMVVILIVIMIIIVAISVISRTILMHYRAFKVGQEIMYYAEAVTKFKTLYDYYPGGLPASKMIGEMRTSPALDSDYNAINTSNATAHPNYLNFGKSDFTSIYAAGIWGVFKQLYAANLIIYPVTFTTYSNAASKNLADAVVVGVLPKSSFDQTSAWLMQYQPNKIPYISTNGHGFLYQSSFNATYDSEWTGRPILSLFSYATHLIRPTFDFSLAPSNSTSNPVGALSAELSALIDTKIDDGKPASGKLVADGNVTNLGCVQYKNVAKSNGAITTLSGANTYPTEDATYSGVKGYKASVYLNSKQDSPELGCVLTYQIQINEDN